MKLIKRVPDDSGILLLSVGRFTEEEKHLENGKSQADFSKAVRLGGGTIGCDRKSLEAWHEKYYSTMRSYLKMNLFAGKDQNMMATSCLETDLCLLLNSDLNNWFKFFNKRIHVNLYKALIKKFYMPISSLSFILILVHF